MYLERGTIKDHAHQGVVFYESILRGFAILLFVIPVGPADGRELRDEANIPSVLGRTRAGARWLFHGNAPGRPLSVSALRQRLLKEGIRSRAARNTALFTLVSDLPAPIVADVLGIHIETAVRWSKYAKCDWLDYLAARGDDLNEEKTRGNTASSE